MIPSGHLDVLLFTLLFLPFALCHPPWDAPNLAIRRPSSASGNATGLNLNSKNNTWPLAFALSLSSSITPLLMPHALTSRDEEACAVPGDVSCAGEQGCCKPDETLGHAAIVPPQAVVHRALSAVTTSTRIYAVLRELLAMFLDAVPQLPRSVTGQPVAMRVPFVALVPRWAAVFREQSVVEVNVALRDQLATTAYAVVWSILVILLWLPYLTWLYDLAAVPTLTFPYLKGFNDEGWKAPTPIPSPILGPHRLKGLKQRKPINESNKYPFASTDEGGGNRTSGVFRCVPEYQNNWQGQLMRGWFNALKNTVKKGSKLNVKVTGIDCSQFKRDTGMITFAGQGSMLWPPLESDPTNQSFVIVSLGDLVAGSYSVDVNLTSGSVTSAYLVDNEGEDLVKPMQISFDLEYDGLGVGLALFTNDTRTNVSYTAVGTPSATTTATETTPTTSVPSGGLVGIEPSWFTNLVKPHTGCETEPLA
ncbi:hypothetical protein DFH08DRAFT_795647 [Mycena albidolilacea]|uniref:Deoxyribonuclease NucA/NucB domain-containing protein n=1 Tax=Mycena albidolilacea TaxID=1033008 RepID=A0AAD7F5Y3_9AGAR|nr:hypothetical protein DFH08DRAFT_795647 [Mycena albidolilacea]